MIEYYPQIKAAHVGFVLASGGLFALRGVLVQLGQRWAMSAPVRYLSYTVDTALLTSALMLLAVLHLNPFTTPWLAVKLAMLLVYVVLGTLALRRARGRRAKFAFYRCGRWRRSDSCTAWRARTIRWDSCSAGSADQPRSTGCASASRRGRSSSSTSRRLTLTRPSSWKRRITRDTVSAARRR